MPVFQLPNEIAFPHPNYAEPDGLLSIGGDLSPRRLLCACQNGIFPWFSQNDPILWWSPNPRCVLFPEKFKLSKSLASLINKGSFEVRFNSCFKSVINQCANVRRVNESGTWITPEMEGAYIKLHQLGWAHSAETFYNGKLVGGLYGLALGQVFFGESMFFTMPNASKVAFYTLVKSLQAFDFKIIDCQITNSHLLSLGAEEIERSTFLSLINTYAKLKKFKKWDNT